METTVHFSQIADGKFQINDLSPVESGATVHCACDYCGHHWSWIRFTPEALNARIAYALEVANAHRDTDYRSYHEAAGRILDKRIDGIGGAEGTSPDKLNATVVVLWEGDKVTDGFSIQAGRRAFNHAFGYMAKCCYDAIKEKLGDNDSILMQISGPDALRLQFAEYGHDASGEANNGKMMKWFNIAANHPIIPQ